MTLRKFLIYFFIILIFAYPVSAAGVSLNRWVLNVTLHDDGTVEEIIQAEIDNAGSQPLDGLSFVVPASGITMIYDLSHTMSFTGMTVDEQAVQNGTKVTVNFNTSVDAGNKWNGRIGFTAQNWAVKDGSNYSIDIPVAAPQAIVGGKSIDVSIPGDADIRSQVFFPSGVEVTSVTPKPFRILFQFDHMVPTWSPDTLHLGDVIHIKSSYSDVLDKIVKTDERWREVKAEINESKTEGINVSQAEAHLNNAEDYNTNQALASYWEKDYKTALEFNGYANNELDQAEKSLPSPGITGNPQENTGSRQSPGFEAAGLVLVLLIYFVVKRK